MEISSHSHFNSKAYLPRQQKYKAEPSNVLPLGKIQNDQKNNPNIEAKTLATNKNASTNEEQNKLAIELNSFQPIHLTQAHQTVSPGKELSYKVTAHDPQIARHAEKAVASYNSVENSQYAQELVNRIEVMV